MDVSGMVAMPPMPDSPLSAPFTESDQSLWFPTADHSPGHWESGVSETKLPLITILNFL